MKDMDTDPDFWPRRMKDMDTDPDFWPRLYRAHPGLEETVRRREREEGEMLSELCQIEARERLAGRLWDWRWVYPDQKMRG